MIHMMTKLEWQPNCFRKSIEECEAAFCSFAANGQKQLLCFDVDEMLKSKVVKKNFCKNGKITSFMDAIYVKWFHMNNMGFVLEIKKGEHVLYEIPKSFEQTEGITYIKRDA